MSYYQSREYLPAEIAEIQKRVEEAATKEVHELLYKDFVDFKTYRKHLTNTRAYIVAGMPVPANNKTPWDYFEIPVGAWRWDRNHQADDETRDCGIARLEMITVDENVMRAGITEDYGVRARMVHQYADKIDAGAKFPAIEGYRWQGKIYVFDGHRRMEAHRMLGKPARAWIEQINDDGYTLTRKAVIEKAIAEGKTIPPEVLEEYNRGFGYQSANVRPTFTYREIRRQMYPSIGEQLDAMYKARQGDDTEIKAIDARIAAIKAKYPKEEE